MVTFVAEAVVVADKLASMSRRDEDRDDANSSRSRYDVEESQCRGEPREAVELTVL